MKFLKILKICTVYRAGLEVIYNFSLVHPCFEDFMPTRIVIDMSIKNIKKKFEKNFNIGIVGYFEAFDQISLLKILEWHNETP